MKINMPARDQKDSHYAFPILAVEIVSRIKNSDAVNTLKRLHKREKENWARNHRDFITKTRYVLTSKNMKQEANMAYYETNMAYTKKIIAKGREAHNIVYQFKTRSIKHISLLVLKSKQTFEAESTKKGRKVS